MTIELDDEPRTRHCESCGRYVVCEEVPKMGYSAWLCRACAAAAYRSGEAV